MTTVLKGMICFGEGLRSSELCPSNQPAMLRPPACRTTHAAAVNNTEFQWSTITDDRRRSVTLRGCCCDPTSSLDRCRRAERSDGVRMDQIKRTGDVDSAVELAGWKYILRFRQTPSIIPLTCNFRSRCCSAAEWKLRHGIGCDARPRQRMNVGVSELSVGLFSSTQPNPTHQITDPTQPPYIEQQLACRKKISLCTSCHHHHPNAHRNNANTHSITSITVILGLFQTDEAVMHQLQVFTKRICQSILDTKLHIYTTCIYSISVISDP